MLRRLTIIVPSLFLAFGILLVSVLRTAAVKYEFSGVVNGISSEDVLRKKITHIGYQLAFPGKVLPDSPLWEIKAARDKLWLATTSNANRKAELLLLFADKRLGASKIFFEKRDAENGYLTLLKAEHYLQLAYDQGQINSKEGKGTAEYLERLALASLKHRQIIEEEILPIAPDDARPGIVKVLGTAKETFEKSSHLINGVGLTPPENPFDRI